MKKSFAAFFAAFLTLAFLTIIPPQSEAQLVKVVTIATADSLLTNADTALVTLTFDGSYKSVEAWVEEVSGTTGGKVYFQGKFPHTTSTDWADLDSLTLADAPTAQYKLFTVPTVRIYVAYRFKFIKSGTGTARIKGFYVRYTGGAIMISNPYQGLANLKRDYISPGLSTPIVYSNYISGILNDRFVIGRKRTATYGKPLAS